MIHKFRKSCLNCDIEFDTYRIEAKYCGLRCVAIAKSKNTGSIPERLANNSEIKANGCIEWTGARNAHGYGVLKFRYHALTNEYGNVSAHRAAYFYKYGEIPSGLFVCHKCDNPPCINPDHLFLGTHQENDQDRVKKGRQIRGSKSYNAKITEEQAALIKLLWLQGMKPTPIARKFGVSTSVISNLVRGKTWQHVSPPLEDYCQTLT